MEGYKNIEQLKYTNARKLFINILTPFSDPVTSVQLKDLEIFTTTISDILMKGFRHCTGERYGYGNEYSCIEEEDLR